MIAVSSRLLGPNILAKTFCHTFLCCVLPTLPPCRPTPLFILHYAALLHLICHIFCVNFAILIVIIILRHLLPTTCANHIIFCHNAILLLPAPSAFLPILLTDLLQLLTLVIQTGEFDLLLVNILELLLRLLLVITPLLAQLLPQSFYYPSFFCLQMLFGLKNTKLQFLYKNYIS